MRIVYVGTSNTRELDAADMHKIDPELTFRKTVWTRGEPLDIDDDVAAVLLSHDWFTGEFAEADEKATPAQVKEDTEGDGPQPGDPDVHSGHPQTGETTTPTGHPIVTPPRASSGRKPTTSTGA